MTRQSCPSYASVSFNAQYRQTVLGGNVNIDPTDYCSISPTVIRQLGCSGTLSECMTSNPCSAGQLAYLADPSILNGSNDLFYPLACVAAQGSGVLGEGEVYIWDEQSGTLVTKVV